MNIKTRKGTAMIELMAAAPFVAVFIVVVFQFASLFGRAVRDIAKANAMAQRAANGWEAANKTSGFKRPCIEGISPDGEFPVSYSFGSGPVEVGLGAWKTEINIEEEVRLVTRPICIPW